MILGLDISTSCTGWCILKEDGHVVDMGAISLSDKKSLYAKAKKIKESLTWIHINNDIQKGQDLLPMMG